MFMCQTHCLSQALFEATQTIVIVYVSWYARIGPAMQRPEFRVWWQITHGKLQHETHLAGLKGREIPPNPELLQPSDSHEHTSRRAVRPRE